MKSPFTASYIDKLISQGKKSIRSDMESAPVWLVKALNRHQSGFKMSATDANALSFWRSANPYVVIQLVRGARELADPDSVSLLQALSRHVTNVRRSVASEVKRLVDSTVSERDREELKDNVSYSYCRAILDTLDIVISEIPSADELASMRMFDLTLFMDASKSNDTSESVAKSKARYAVPLLYHLNGEITRRYPSSDWKKIISKLTGYAFETVRGYCKDDLNEKALNDVKYALEVLLRQVDERISKLQRKSLKK